MTRWQRPRGPLNVWKVIDGYEPSKDGSTKVPVKFSIQDVPDDESRRQEVIDHLCTYFLEDEPLSKSTDIKNDKEGVECFKSLWRYGLEQGVAIGCYQLDPDGRTIGQLVGVNVLFIMTEQTSADFGKLKAGFKSDNFKAIWRLFEELVHMADVTKIYDVDTYISSISLSVNPAYRGQKLGFHIIAARDDMARKYGIRATSTMFTAKASQRQAERAGLETRATIYYDTFLDQQANPLFPNIQSDCVKLMMKQFKLD